MSFADTDRVPGIHIAIDELKTLAKKQLALAEEVGVLSRRGKDALQRGAALAYAVDELHRRAEEIGETECGWDRVCDGRR